MKTNQIWWWNVGLKVSEDSKTKTRKLTGYKCFVLNSEENFMLSHSLVIQTV